MGHSMGGLDARLVVRAYPEIAARCASVTTLSTPHRGSAVADWAVRQLDGASARAPELDRVLALFGDDVSALRQLTTWHMAEVFNTRVRDDSRVRYFSFGFAVPSPVVLNLHVPWLWFTHALLVDAGRPLNDGLVDSVSARWGEFQGIFAGDHWSETGPIPIGGRLIYRETFSRALDLLDRRF
jgi:triacylglycerol lipase